MTAPWLGGTPGSTIRCMDMQKLFEENLLRNAPVRATTTRNRARIAQMWRERRAARGAA
jgi:hypothetical protein